MRFFTPELYIRFNSDDEAVADEANEDWETAIREYQRHLGHIHYCMPTLMRKLTEICLHDAELLAIYEVIEPLPNWSAMEILSIKQDGKIVSLIYQLWDRIRDYPPLPYWPFSKIRLTWLYDEIEMVSNHHEKFLHRILLSNGRVLEIPFHSVIVHTLILSPPGPAIRQSA